MLIQFLHAWHWFLDTPWCFLDRACRVVWYHYFLLFSKYAIAFMERKGTGLLYPHSKHCMIFQRI